MTHDPIRQADMARRLSNLAKARRCGAKTRAGHPCRQAAVRERIRCRMHGGAKGSGGPLGDRNGNFKHGGRKNRKISSAEIVYNRINCPPMLLWLAEAAGAPN